MKRIIMMMLALSTLALCACTSKDNVDTRGSENTSDKDFYVEFLSTGKSDAAIIKLPSKVIMCDTADMDDYEQIQERLRVNGIEKIDMLILTHFDRDHIGSAQSVISDYEVGSVYMPDYTEDSPEYAAMMSALSESDAQEVRLKSEVSLMAEGANIWLNPPKKDYGDDNNNSLIVSISYDGSSLLITGDALKKRIGDFCSDRELKHYDVIKMPHHGDYNRKINGLLSATTPRYAVITSDVNRETVEEKLLSALDAYGVETLYTSSGIIAFQSTENGLELCKVR